MEIRRVLVTGGGGYIGSVLVEALLCKGYEVIALDRFYFGSTLNHLNHPNLTVTSDDVRWVRCEIFADVDAVCDLAALSNDPTGDLNPELTKAINASGRARIAKLAHGMGVKRYILASSCSVYGDQETWVTEESSVNPLTTYARANLEAEHAALSLNNPKFCVTSLRQATVYGLSHRMRFDLVLNAMTLSLLKHGEVGIQRNGAQWRPLIHVRDAAQAYIHILESEPSLVNGQIFNVGANEQNIQMLPLAKKIAKSLDVPCTVKWYGETDRRSYRVNFDKIKRLLGYVTRFLPEDGVQEIARAWHQKTVSNDPTTMTVEWYRYLMQEGKF